MDTKIKKLLETSKVKYKLVEHKKVYTAFTGAQTQHTDPKGVVKTVLVKLSKPLIFIDITPSTKNGTGPVPPLLKGRLGGVKPEAIDFVMVAVPAKHRVDFKKIAKAVNDHALKSYKLMVRADESTVAKAMADKSAHYKAPSKVTVKMAAEKDITKKLKTKVGLLSAFSIIYNLPLLADKKLLKNNKLIVAAGSYTESIEISTKDFLKLTNGMQGNFTE